MMFRDQVGVLASWFKGWNECEQTVALLSLLKRVSRTQARFLQLCLEHSLAECTELHVLEVEANNPAVIGQWQVEPKERLISLVLTHLPLLKPGNGEAKSEYMRLLPKILTHTIEFGRHLEESRQLLSYALIHPATSLEDRADLALWLNHLEERAATRTAGGGGGGGGGGGDSLERVPSSHHLYAQHQRYGSDDRLNGWQGSRDSGIATWHTQQQQQGCENGHLLLYPSSSVPSTINTVGTGSGSNSILQSAGQHSPLKRSVSLTPPMSGSSTQPLGHGWLSQEDLRGRGAPLTPDHAPLSPQSSVASSGSGGSEHLEDGSGLGMALRSSFNEEGSGMRGEGTVSVNCHNVPAWLKSLRLHKYAGLFSTMTYDEMMSLTEQQLEAQSVTKGARHKIIISIQKLKERQNMLRSLEKDVLEGGNLRSPLQELHYIVGTPIKAFNSVAESPQRSLLSAEGKSAATGVCVSGGEAESSTTLIAEGDIPAQFTRVMGKVCTQLLVSRPDEENISSYLQLINKCELHEAFTETQKKRLSSWRQQVQKLVRSFPRKPLLDMTGYRQQRSSRGFGQSNSLPSAVCVGSSVCSRRNLRQFPVPSRSLPAPRLGLLGTTGLLTHTHTPRSSNNTPTNLKQGRQGLWFANPGGSNSMPSRTHSSVQRTRSLPVHTNPHTMAMFQQADLQVPVTEPDINNRLESLCRSMTEHALEDGVDRTSTI
ncbi:protein Smaug homolog 1 isoform X1 [Hemibagrus wyckioides]|uniref:protein Smaug homolog 1 isoform X1 n=1 Tax=Hemibagrus wyckioides TaxID=337641 RepID=UPI00266DA927|nr:protein Smaug homolog 1 isoform X1 [Hemibagrus wyckioides]XP_058254832.1 protein Smaug homolog 1 isoform X1 [Hemibagrus wyckioides]